MIKSQEDEFIAVRVQDPRVQNEGSWSSYVDFKIFLHTNSKAFTAKTSCVRRRYSEFVWLKRKLQKNAGLVPVPDLPKKSLFSFINDDFIETRRKGLQSFLDKVLHMTVCLSDSQLHLFLQTQLPVRHIEDCVQGHTPYTVTEAILTYASSNRGWVQEEGSGAQELWSAPVPYESVESPAPHLPSLHCGGAIATTTSDLTDVSDVETEPRLNDAKQTAPDTLQGNPHEQMFQEDESPVNLVVEVHQEVSLPSFVETELEPVNIVSDETERLDKKDKDLQGYGCKYTATQTDRPLEEEPQQVATDSKAEDLDKVLQDQETSVAKDVVEISSVDEFTEKSTLDDIDEEKGSQEAALKQNRTMRQTLDEDGHEEDPNITVHYNEGTQDLDKAEQSNHRGQVPFETRAKTQEDVTLQDCHVAKVLQEDTPNNEDQEQDIVHITEDVAILENGLSDEDSSIEASVHEEVKNETICNQSEIATHISCTDCNKDVVVEVNKLNAKCAHTSSEILILEGIQEVLSTQTVQVVENDSTEIPYDHSLNADTANVNTLVLQALEIDSVQYQEKDSPIIFTTHQTDAN